MKIRISLFVLLVGLVITGCHGGGNSATAQVLILRAGPLRVSSIVVPGTATTIPSNWEQLECEKMKSPDVLASIITDLNLDHVWARRLNKPEPLSKEDALAYLEPRLKLDMKEVQTAMPLVTITVTGDVPQESADIANAIADHYKAMRDRQDEQSYSDGVQELKQEVAEEQRVLDASENTAFEHPTSRDGERMIDYGKMSLQNANADLQRAIDGHQHGYQSAVQIVTRAVP